MPLLSMRQYAKHRGVTVEAVSKAVKRGRISCKRNELGYALIDPEVADAEWSKNSDETKMREPAPEPVVEPVYVAPETKGPSLTQSAAVLKAYQARMAKLEFEIKSEKYALIEEVEKKWVTIATLARTKILGVASKCRQRIPDLTPDQYKVIEAIVRETLEDLADGEN